MAKRMVLVDEKLYEQYKIAYTLWKQPITDTAKSNLSDKLESKLNNETIADDIKAKEFQQNLYRFLHTNRELPELQPLSLNGLMQEPKTEEIKHVSRRSKRKSKQPKWESFYT
jgi:hypothetical protein